MRKEIDLPNLPYAHRQAAAKLLIAKAGRIADSEDLAYGDMAAKDIAKVRQAISLYDMALLLLKPYDGNYNTIIHWKCLLLIELEQYEDAREWYEELIKLNRDSQGNNFKDPTAKGALQKLKQLKGKTNTELPPVEEKDGESLLDNPGYCWWANRFCEALEKGDYRGAHHRLSKSLGKKISEEQLEKDWAEMVNGADVEVLLTRHENATDDDPKGYVGWCYFVVEGHGVNEAISLEIIKDSENHYKIRSVDFGRP